MSDFKGGSRKKPWHTKFSQQKYACCCPMMRTYCGDVLLSTCKDCKKHGKAIPNYRPCKCQCQTGIFWRRTSKPWPTRSYAWMSYWPARESQTWISTQWRTWWQWLQALFLKVSSFFWAQRQLLMDNEKMSSLLHLDVDHTCRYQARKSCTPFSSMFLSPRYVRDVANANRRKKGKRHYQNGLRCNFFHLDYMTNHYHLF